MYVNVTSLGITVPLYYFSNFIEKENMNKYIDYVYIFVFFMCELGRFQSFVLYKSASCNDARAKANKSSTRLQLAIA